MKPFGKLMFLSLCLFAAAACSKSPEENPDDPKQPVITLRNSPEEAKALSSVTIRATVTVASGTISSVTLHYNDGSDKSVKMDVTTIANEYAGSFTTPSTVGKTVKYYIKAVTAEDRAAQSETITLTTVGELSNPATGLRLNEIGTSGDNKFIEIYNPSGSEASLGGVSLWKNGEELVAFTSSLSVGGKGYGVYRAKGTTFTIPASATDLGTTETGLSGSKSLSVELRYNGVVIDAFANTINPGVAQMTAADWDGEPETDGTNFIRRAGDTYGWYAAPITGEATPGKINGTSGTRLNHQLLAADAVADKPYITNIVINPDNPTKGLSPAYNVIQFSVYYDVHSAAPTIASSNGSPAVVSGVVYKITPSLSSSAAGASADITITAANGKGTATNKFTVLAFTDATTFGTYEDIRLNEIYTKSADAIELYNTSDNPVVISGMRIRKNKDRIFTVPGHMVMKGKSFAVLGCNGKDYNGDGGALNLGTVSNGLSGSKSLLIELRRPKVEGGEDNSTNIDDFVNTAAASPNKDTEWDGTQVEHTFESAGRRPDGTGSWYVLTPATIGKTNSTASQGSQFTKSYNQ